MLLRDCVPVLTEIESEKLLSEASRAPPTHQSRHRPISRTPTRPVAPKLKRCTRLLNPRRSTPLHPDPRACPGRRISQDDIKRQAVHLVEQDGIVFIDEIDKICSRGEVCGPETRPPASDAQRTAFASSCATVPWLGRCVLRGRAARPAAAHRGLAGGNWAEATPRAGGPEQKERRASPSDPAPLLVLSCVCV